MLSRHLRHSRHLLGQRHEQKCQREINLNWRSVRFLVPGGHNVSPPIEHFTLPVTFTGRPNKLGTVQRNSRRTEFSYAQRAIDTPIFSRVRITLGQLLSAVPKLSI
jgi:hypothetical protein